MEPLIPALLGHVLNEGFVKNSDLPLWLIPLAFVGVFIFRGVFTFCAQYAMSWASSKSILDIRTDLIDTLVNADAQVFHEVTPGIAVTKVVNDPQAAVSQISGATTTLLRDGSHTVAMLGYLFYLNWQLTLLSLVTVPLLAYTVRKVHRRTQAVGALMYGSQLRLVGVIDDIARAWRVVRTFDAGEFEKERFTKEAIAFRRNSLKTTAATSMMTPVSQTITSLGVAAIIWLALAQAQNNAKTVGEFVAFITALLLLVSRIRSLTDLSQSVTQGFIAAGGFFALMDSRREPDPGKETVEGLHKRILIENVTVHYDGAAAPSLQDITIEIPVGKTVALVGASGAGKSTIVNLLLGFAQPQSGRVLFDERELRDVSKASLREQFAVVAQDTVLFDGSIASNVVYAKPRDEQRLTYCLEAAHLLHHVQTMSDGVETPIGANGSKLSGGQRQRLAIARALYKEAPVWIFDEATSALDTESEQAVHAALERWHGSKTLLVIAHRLSTVRNADRIYVLSEGGLIEHGTHEELLLRHGAYAAMVAAQNGHAIATPVV
jgi:subfamily B ATP-binding cassette protein MsbA